MGNKADHRMGTVGRRAANGLREFREALESGREITARFTVRSVKLDLQPEDYTADEIRTLRESLGVSQALFAELICCSVHTVQAWEHGKRTPSPTTRRLLDQIRYDPQGWLGFLNTMAERREAERSEETCA